MRPPNKRFYNFGPFRLDVEECLLLREGQPVPLKPKAFETLTVLVQNSGHMLEKEALMRCLWPDSFVEEANLTVNVSQVRKALAQNGDVDQYIETVPKRGYRFVAPVRETWEEPPDLIVCEHTRSRIIIEEQETNTDEADQPAIAVTRLPASAELIPSNRSTNIPAPITLAKQRKVPSALLAATLCAALVVVAYLIYAKRPAPIDTPIEPHSLAILPFRNLRPDKDTDFLGSAMADVVISKLGHIRALLVRPSSYTQRYRNQEVDPAAVAKELGVDKLLTGSFLKDGDDLRVTVQLVDVSRRDILWRETIDVKHDKLLTMEDRIAEQIINGLQINLSPEEAEKLKLDAPQNPRAYEDYLRGRYLISSNEQPTAIKLLEESVALDSNYALAWTYLGKAYSVTASQYFGGREFHDKAQLAYEKALALKPQQLETRVLLANFLTENNRVEESVPMLRKVIAENPNHAFARWELSYAYRYAGMLDQSIAEGENALQLSPHITGHLFNSYLYAGQHDKFLSSLPMRDDAYTLFYRGLGNYYLGDWTRASFYFDRAYQLDSAALVSQIGRVLRLALDGHNREGIEVLKAAESKLEKDPFVDGELSYKLAECYSVLGDTSSALRLLKKSIEQGFFCYPYLVSDPLLDHVRGEAQYAALMELAHQRHERFKRSFF